MRTRTIAAVMLAACLPLAGCGGRNDDRPKDTATFDCTAQEVSQTDWMKHCSDEGAPAESAGEEQPPDELKLGASAETVGEDGTGRLEITPTSVVYLKQGGSETPKNGSFAVVTIKDRPTTAVAAEEANLMANQGWQWVAPDGQAIDEGNGNAFNVVAESFNSGGAIQPGTFKWDSIVFDLSEAQHGGTLLYTDGEDTTYRWTMPTKDEGPHVEKVKKELS